MCHAAPICRFCEDNFVGEMETTIGVDFYLSEIIVNGKKIKVSVCSEPYFSTTTYLDITYLSCLLFV